MDFGSTLVSIFGIIFLFGIPVAAFIIHRVLKHQERIEMIRHGLVPPPNGSGQWQNFGPSKTTWTPPSGMPQPPPVYGYDMYSAAQCQLRKGISISLIGLAIFIGLSFINPGHPGPWLLGGLIPMFVGLAQVITALLSGARFGPPAPPYQVGPAPGPQQQSAPPPPRDVTPGPYAYRPGSTTELEAPPGPPDLRQ